MRPTKLAYFIAYYRVSTDHQGRSGLGLEGQQMAVIDFIKNRKCVLIDEFTEVESGRNKHRPELLKALAACRIYGAKLIIAKLDRLARNVAFISSLMDSKVDFVAVDFPDANPLTIHILAAVAEHERELISERTKAALAAAKARGVVLGNDNLTDEARKSGNRKSAEVRARNAKMWCEDLVPLFEEIQQSGVTTYQGIAEVLNKKKIPTRRGGRWQATQVKRVMELVA